MFTYFSSFPLFFFFNDTATTEIYTLSLHDALPIWGKEGGVRAEELNSFGPRSQDRVKGGPCGDHAPVGAERMAPLAAPKAPAKRQAGQATAQEEHATRFRAMHRSAGTTARSTSPSPATRPPSEISDLGSWGDAAA